MSDNLIKRIIQPSARGRLWQIFLLIIILVVIGGLVDAGSYYNKGTDWLAVKTNNTIKLPHTKEIPFRLGLDLLGGTHLVYQADMSAVEGRDQSSALEGVRDVIERRVNVFGVSEPIVQTSISGGDYRVIVELAGIKDVNEAINMIGETPLLEFKEQTEEQRELTEEERNALNEFNSEAEKKAEEVLGKLISGGDFEELAREFSQDDASKEQGGDLGWLTEQDNPEIVNLAKTLEPGEYTTELNQGSFGYEILKLDDRRTKTNPFDDNKEEKEVKATHLLLCYNEIAGCEDGPSKEEALEKINQIKNQATPNNFTDLVKENSTEPGADTGGGELGWFDRGDMVGPFEEAVYAQAVGTISEPVETQFGYHLIHKQDERSIYEYKISRIFIQTLIEQDIIGGEKEWKNTELTGKNLDRATVQFNPNDNTPEVSLEFDSEGAKLFEDITDRNVGDPVAIYLDSYPISVPTVNEKITGGRAVISGNFNIEEAKLLAQRLNAGALPVPINLINQQTVGASLGKISLTESLEAGILGLILVAIFMILYYRLPGILAVLSLITYGILVLAVFKTLPIWLSFVLITTMIILMIVTLSDLKLFNFFSGIVLVILGIILLYFSIIPVTLTLAGLAGFILSIGMAVDANVLIFERFKEEMATGKPMEFAIKDSFNRAWPSIRDGNVSTLMTCFILAWFSTSVVKGFAITLAIGIIISMFSAIVITKNLLQLVSDEWLEKKPWLAGVKKPKNN